MKEENHVVFEIINEKIAYVCELFKVFEDSKYKYAFDTNNFPLKTAANKYWDFLLNIKRRTNYNWEQFNREYDKRLYIKKEKSK